MWPWVVVNQFEVLVFEREDIIHVRIDDYAREFSRRSGELQLSLFKVIEIEVSVSRCMDKLSWLKIAHLRHHLKQESVGGDIERHTEEGVCRALIELQRESPVCHIELEEAMTWWQRHLWHISNIPRATHDAS